MRTVKLFVEGGGDSNSLHRECRRAFAEFLEKTELKGFKPRIVAGGSRNNTYDSYCTAIKNGEDAALLIDSESAIIIPVNDSTYDSQNIRTWKPWHHLCNRCDSDGQPADNWSKPQNAADADCHLMVETMESWFMADIDTLKQYYGKGFNAQRLPSGQNIENITKNDIKNALKSATRNTNKGEYNKGVHSFKILENIDPTKVRTKSQWVDRFITLLSEKMGSFR